MAATVARHLSSRLRGSAIHHVPTFRSKDPESFRGKLARDRARHELQYFESEFAPAVLDLAGVRVLLYRPSDVEPACDVITELFDIPDGDRFRRDYAIAEGYQSRHRVVTLREETFASDPALSNLKDVLCEVQVVTIGDHIWNELEHDIKYKTPAGQPSGEQSALLMSLRRNLNLVRATVDDLMSATDRQRQVSLAAIASPEDLRQALKARSGRTLTGDLERCLMLLEGVMREVTPAGLDKLPLGSADLDGAAARLRAAGMGDPGNDVALVVVALWTLYRPEFIQMARSWRGRRGPVGRLVHTLDKMAQEGRI
jgi:ppGpp synthetase/RelA/SpoT-type nucleotidyltranferase